MLIVMSSSGGLYNVLNNTHIDGGESDLDARSFGLIDVGFLFTPLYDQSVHDNSVSICQAASSQLGFVGEGSNMGPLYSWAVK